MAKFIGLLLACLYWVTFGWIFWILGKIGAGPGNMK